MKILTELKKIDLIEDYINADGIIINTPFTSSPNPQYPNINDNINFIINWCKKNGKEVIFRIDKILTEDEIDLVINFIKQYIDYSFIYSDFAIFTYFKGLNRLDQLYYFAQTYLVNKEDVKYYTDLGVKVLLSNELSKKEIELINEYSPNNIGIFAYGYFPIFYSKRKVISLYKEHVKNDLNTDVIGLSKYQVYDIKEELRNELYKIYEGKDFSCIFSYDKLCITDDDLDLNKFEFLFISNYFIKDEDIKEILDYYNELKKTNKKEQNKEILNNFKNKHATSYKSFLYKNNEIL